jgi:hypothetical protein
MSNVKILQSAAQQHILQFHVTMDNAKRMHVAHACHMIPLGTNGTKPRFLGAETA